MSKIRLICQALMFLSCAVVAAQAPQKMSYQSVVRNATGNLVANAQVSIKVSILQDSPTGNAVYVETHNILTNQNGLATMEIGGGNIELGSFSVINWSAHQHFSKIEVDPLGGTNYTISAINQFLSVPYALYAENTKSKGKTTIYITGDITDSEAAAKIAMEAGPDTENIYICGTTVLTSVTISAGLKSLINLKIVNNPLLQSVTIHDLKQIDGSFIIQGSPFSNVNNLALLSLPDLEAIYGEELILTGKAFLNISMPSLTKIFNYTTTLINYNGTLTLPSLQALSLNGTSNSVSLDGLICPVLQNCTTRNIIYVKTLDMQGLQHVSYLAVEGVESLNLNNLSTGRLGISTSPLVTNLELPSFTSGTLSIGPSNGLTSISLPSLTTFGSGTAIQYNYNLTNISFPLLSHIDNSSAPVPNLLLQHNRLPSSVINNILQQLLSITPLKAVYLKQLTPAPPTGQGIIDKETLILQGNTIQTD